MEKVRVVCGVAQRTHAGERQVFLAQRGPGGPHAGLWEFPGGKVEPGETDTQAIQRELMEELGCATVVLEPLGSAADDRIVLVALRVRFSAPPTGLENQAIAWANLSSIGELPMPPCDREILELILSHPNPL